MSQIIEVIERYEIPDIPDIDLPEEDGEPLETSWHRAQISLLIEIITHWWRERRNFFAGGNLFVYYSLQQARNRDYKGPDFFIVKDVEFNQLRRKWVVWEENGRLPNLIVELMSPSTAQQDLTVKKQLYADTFRTPEYFCYDPDTMQLYGWRLGTAGYEPLRPNAQGRLWSHELNAWLGLWRGEYLRTTNIWLRFYDTAGQLILSEAEDERQRAETEFQRAEVERQRAEDAEGEVERLRKELAQQKKP